MTEYIERQKAVNVCEMHYQHCLEMYDWSGDTTADAIKTDIETIPAADVVEVRHGEWLPIEHEYRNKFERVMIADEFDCNICGSRLGYEANYCPNCGAKMDGERKEQK